MPVTLADATSTGVASSQKDRFRHYSRRRLGGFGLERVVARGDAIR